MKRIFYCVLLASFIIGGCSTTKTRIAKINNTIDSLKSVFAPDPRVAVFNVSTQVSGSSIVLRGDVDNPKAKEVLFSELQREGVAGLIDSVVLLPEASLGSQAFGLVDISVANVYSAPKYEAEMVNQVLLGHTVRVLKERDGWFYIKSTDNYLGWAVPGSIFRVDSATLAAYDAQRKLVVTSIYATLYDAPGKKGMTVSDAVLADFLTPIGTAGADFKVQLPDGRIAYISRSDVQYYDDYLATHKPTLEGIEEIAMKLIGFPYVWGGTSSKGVDCSGFTKTVFRMNGIRLPRDASQQVAVGRDIDPGPNFENLKKGDLLFFGTKAEAGKPEKIVHVAIYLGKGYFIQSSNRVRISSLLKSDSAFDQYDLDRFVRAKRILPVGTNVQAGENILEKSNN